MQKLKVEELTAERKRFEALGELCQLYGETDGATACRSIVRAITHEQVALARSA